VCVGVMDTQRHLTTVECHRCEARTDAAYKEDQSGKRCRDRSFRLWMECPDNSGNARYRGWNAPSDLHRLLTTKLERREGSPQRVTEPVESETRQAQEMPAKRHVHGNGEDPKARSVGQRSHSATPSISVWLRYIQIASPVARLGAELENACIVRPLFNSLQIAFVTVWNSPALRCSRAPSAISKLV
jgi:hypothetical protein